MTQQVEEWSEALPAGTRAAVVARAALRRILTEAEADHLLDATLLATSELVTNALVHAGPAVELSVWATSDAVRVEVSDRSRHLPTARDYAVTAATGRGLRLVEHSVDRWGAIRRPDGKSVWFEIGTSLGQASQAEPLSARGVEEATLDVTLRRFPILMHWAWQEHASALLREYLLYACEDDPSVLEGHAQASDALNVLHEQTPVPDLPDDPDDLLNLALEPAVTAAEVLMRVPPQAVPHFRTLDEMLSRAREAATQERFLSPPTQPEMEEMRRWLCREVERQEKGQEPTPWQPRTQVRTALYDADELERRYQGLAETAAAILVTNAASVIVAVSPAALRLLQYAESADLVGRRVLVVVPSRYHQAHIAGTTLNATNGRDTLLGVPITVPFVVADGREVLMRLQVVPRMLEGGEGVFVATITPASGA